MKIALSVELAYTFYAFPDDFMLAAAGLAGGVATIEQDLRVWLSELAGTDV
ncbi:MAG: hypothetical protein M3373_13175 [Gemmatimonadota bacterium]|nr:hypothetical protein [Gemmatimonadota bacterium]